MLIRVLSIMRKEFLHIIRDPRTLAVMFLIPVIQLVMLGYAATTDIKHLSTAVWDQDQSPASRALVDAYRASGYFDITTSIENELALAQAMLLSFFILLPAIFLSGYFFPIDAMPVVLQHVSKVVPLTYILIIVRAIILKGVGFEALQGEAVALSLFGTATLMLAATRFQKRLE